MYFDGDIMYFYLGISLKEYCQNNNIKYESIHTRIWKMKHSKKYAGYSDEEIIKIAIETYGKSIKYMYKGVTLRQYCLDHNLNLSTICSRIAKLKKENPTMSDDEIVVIAIENFQNKNYKFFYQGLPLKEYCELHPEIKYASIRSYIKTIKAKNPELTDEEIIESYINKEHKGIYKFYYTGIPLKEYCTQNNLNYKNIISYMSRWRNNPQFQNLSDDEFVEAIMDQYQPFEPKYLYQGISLNKYCTENNLSYYSVVSYVKRSIAKGSSKSLDELVEEGIKTINRYGIIYYYQGIPLFLYAKQNNLNANSIRITILRRASKSNKPLQEIVNECVESYQKKKVKYWYNNEPLFSYCSRTGLNYSTVISKYLDIYADRVDISTTAAIKEIVDDFLVNPPIRYKYFFGNQTLAKLCEVNGYPYLSIYNRIKTLKAKGTIVDSEQIITEAISKYEKRLKINTLNDIFTKLKKQQLIDEDIQKICSKLKISWQNVKELKEMDFSYNQTINLIWFFGDRENETHDHIITDTKISEIFSIVRKLEEAKNNITEFSLYDLIGIYKSELYDSRSAILELEINYIYKVVYSLSRNYNVKIDKTNLEDFVEEIKLYILLLIDRTTLNNIGQIIKYMDISIKGYFRTYLKKYKELSNTISLNESKYKEDKGTKSETSLEGYIADPHNQYEDIESPAFSSQMLEVLKTLSTDDLNFIILKYQEGYSDTELASFYKISLGEVKEREISILLMLKDNEKIKKLKKSLGNS